MAEIDDEFLLGLPGDPEEAFPVFEAHVRKEFLNRSDENSEFYWERRYLTQVFAFASYFNFNIGVSTDMPSDYSHFREYYDDARGRIEFFITQTRLKIAYQRRAGNSAIYVLSPALKREIRHYVEQIKEIIEKLSLPEIKKNTLMGKLNAFVSEIDRERTKLDAAISAWIWVNPHFSPGVGASGL